MRVEVRSAEPLVDMTMMRIRGVWTTNTAAFLLGAGMYASFIVFPQFAQLPTQHRLRLRRLGRRVRALPAALDVGDDAARALRRAESRPASDRARRCSAGTAFAAASFAMLALAHAHPYEMLIAAALLGIGIGLAFAALGNLIVQAVPSHQTGVASGMNTVMRTLGGALGGQLSATFIAANTAHGLPTVTGFTDTFVMATVFLIACLGAAALVPRALGRVERTSPQIEGRAAVADGSA